MSIAMKIIEKSAAKKRDIAIPQEAGKYYAAMREGMQVMADCTGEPWNAMPDSVLLEISDANQLVGFAAGILISAVVAGGTVLCQKIAEAKRPRPIRFEEAKQLIAEGVSLEEVRRRMAGIYAETEEAS